MFSSVAWGQVWRWVPLLGLRTTCDWAAGGSMCGWSSPFDFRLQQLCAVGKVDALFLINHTMHPALASLWIASINRMGVRARRSV
jgi:hypothetical protein